MVKQPVGRVYSGAGEFQPEAAIGRRVEIAAVGAKLRKLGQSSRRYSFQSYSIVNGA